jgi:4-amino-4-deoxy-L-arabinose transferase-like glycosyltransferase
MMDAVNKFVRRYKYYLIIVSISVVYIFLSLYWVRQNARPPHWDMARHLYNIEIYSDLLQQGEIYKIATTYLYYPPFSYLIVALAYVFVGSTLLNAVAVNFIWLLVLGFSLVSVGGSLRRPRVGILAFVFFITMPLVGSVTKEVQLDFPLAAMLAANLALLLRSQKFAKFNFSLLYGISFGLGMLTKWTFLIFAIWPLAIAGANLVKNYKHNKNNIKNLILALLTAYALAMPWYVVNLSSIKADFIANGVSAGVREGDPPPLTLGGLSWYPRNIIEFYLRLPWLVGVAAAFMALRGRITKQTLKPDILYVISMGVGGFIVFTLLQNKDIRYIMPVLMILALLIGLGLDALLKRKYLIWVSGIMVAIVLSFLLTSFTTNLNRVAVNIKHIPFSLAIWSPIGYITGPPETASWCMEDAMTEIKKLNQPFIYQGPDTIWFNNWALQYLAARENVAIGGTASDGLGLIKSEQIAEGALWKCQAADGSIVSIVENHQE